MPIDRPEGRHWCAPTSEQPDEHRRWTCPGCSTTWELTGNVWIPTEEAQN